jgi:hypothetical protein
MKHEILVSCEKMGGDLEGLNWCMSLDTCLLERVCCNWLVQLTIPSVEAINGFKWYEFGGIRR